MLMDIFSSFDSYQFNSFTAFNKLINTFIITLPFTILLLTMSSVWPSISRSPTILTQPLYVMFEQTMRTKSKILKGYPIILSSLFLIIISLNLVGLIAFSFSITSHLIFTLIFGLPLWLSSISSSLMNNKKEFIAHLLPSGAPDWLNPFLVLIETISISVRPLTLSFRLAANMTAGHIVLALIGFYLSTAMFSMSFYPILLTLVSMGYILFEIAICIIQAYIFCLLLSLYTDDHTH
uniref:ATP synthase F0 subunit 6 n=1 Tax=Barbronia yunnanensis TaxID=3027017 RepID=UPI0023D7C949|nr:ATP synthase F0 subunit 6 [Barbronia yunnanensis]WDA96189.1 ATP synthase F0 subunit 6 [Barbronia yunnanensis]